MNVLVVEDEPGAREALVELVKELGYKASAASSVAEPGERRTSASPTSASRTATASTWCGRQRPRGATAPSWF